ncbi:MAG: hypothetical protein DRI61_12270 [Chloroflexi bacterium]|nr:MAG: hypothetical protein DRI61_12270 [Chloroflexota bacterium]
MVEDVASEGGEKGGAHIGIEANGGRPGAQSTRLSRERALEAPWQARLWRAFTAQAGAFSPGSFIIVL